MRLVTLIIGILATAAFNGQISAAQQAVTSKPASSGPAVAAPPNPADAKPTAIYDEKADVKALIAEALVRAGKENRRVLVQWGGNWCGWCVKLHGLYKSDKEIARKLMYEYEVVFADAGRPDEKNVALAMSYGADLNKHGLPFLTILDADGKALANQETGSLENKDQEAAPGHDPKAVLDFLTKHQAPYRNAQEILDIGLAEASQSDRRVFLHFGAPWCGWCRRLERWMDREDVKSILAKDFVDVKIDIDRTIGGKDVLTKYNTKASGGIPWMAFLDSHGKSITTSDDEKGNIGFPAQPAEIAHFKSMLEQAKIRLTTQDIETLAASLAKKPD